MAVFVCGPSPRGVHWYALVYVAKGGKVVDIFFAQKRPSSQAPYRLLQAMSVAVYRTEGMKDPSDEKLGVGFIVVRCCVCRLKFFVNGRRWRR